MLAALRMQDAMHVIRLLVQLPVQKEVYESLHLSISRHQGVEKLIPTVL